MFETGFRGCEWLEQECMALAVAGAIGVGAVAVSYAFNEIAYDFPNSRQVAGLAQRVERLHEEKQINAVFVDGFKQSLQHSRDELHEVESRYALAGLASAGFALIAIAGNKLSKHLKQK